MRKILITGANSFVGTSVAQWLMRTPEDFEVDTVDTMDDAWRQVDFSQYDSVFHVAGIAHVDPKPEMASLYYRVNRDLAIDVAKVAKEQGAKQFIYMSSKIVYQVSRSLKGDCVTVDTEPCPNDFYGDSKLQAEKGLSALDCDTFKVAILRPPMIYGPSGKGNFQRLAWLASKLPVFPLWHNKRSMLYIDNLSEFVKQVIVRSLSGTFYPQNKEYVDTCEVIRLLSQKYGRKVWITRLLNPFVFLGSFLINPINKMFSDSYYVQEMSSYDFEYCVVDFNESLKDIEPRKMLR